CTLVPMEDQVPTWGGTIDERFWSPLGPRSSEQLQAVLAQLTNGYQERLRNFNPGLSSIQALEELLAMLHKAKIAASVVMVPQGPTLRSLYDAEKVGDLVRRVADLSLKNGYSFIRAFDWLEEHMFADSIHPTVAGADIFTKRIAQEVLLPALKKE